MDDCSEGYRQRVGIAQAILPEPDLLILDEPTEGLDPNQRVEIRELITSLGQERTVVLSTHVMQEVQLTCDRLLIIHDGRIVSDGPVDAVLRAWPSAGGRGAAPYGIPGSVIARKSRTSSSSSSLSSSRSRTTSRSVLSSSSDVFATSAASS